MSTMSKTQRRQLATVTARKAVDDSSGITGITGITGAPVRPAYLVLWFVLLCGLVFCVYAPALHGEFMLDDVSKVQNNPDIRDWDQLWSNLIHRYPVTRTLEEKFQADMHNDPSRPVVSLTYALNYHWGKDHTFGYHLVNLLLHCVNILLFWLLTCYIWLHIFKKRSVFFPCVVATLFAIHPVNSAVVSYIYSRSDLLATLFFLSALLLFYTFAGNTRRIGLYVLTILCFLLSLLSKQSTATFPLVALVFDYMILSDFSLAGLRKRQYFHLGLWLVLFGYLLARVLYFGQVGDLEAAETWPAYNYAITQPFSIMKYLQLILVPIGLCLDHGLDAARSLFEPRIIWSCLGIIGIIAGVRYAYRRRTPPDKMVVFYAIWFFLAIAPTSTILPTTAVLVENRIYLAGVAWAGLFGLGYLVLWQAAQHTALWRNALIGLFIVHLGILSGITYVHNDAFRTREKMWLSADQLYPRRSRTQQGLGDVYLYDKQDYEKATEHYEELVEIDQHLHRPVPMNIFHNLGSMYVWKGDSAKAAKDYPTAQADYQKGVDDYQHELALYPDSLAAHKDLAFTFCVLNRYPDAEREYRECLRLDPQCERAYYVIGACCQNTGRIAEALEDYRHALALDPNDAGVQKNLAQLTAALQRGGRAGK